MKIGNWEIGTDVTVRGERRRLSWAVGWVLGAIGALIVVGALVGFLVGLVPDRWWAVAAVGNRAIYIRPRALLALLLLYLLLRRERK